MTKYSSWIHGSAVQIEREGYFLSTRRQASGARLETHGKEWFHFAIPTPAVVNNVSTVLRYVYVLYRTERTARIVSLHLYDGPVEFKKFENLSLAGDHSGNLDAQNTWAIANRHIQFGLGITIRVDFGLPTHQGVPQITFTSAGADFFVSNQPTVHRAPPAGQGR